MTLALTVVQPRIDTRDYPQLPTGVSRWIASAGGTGGTTGVATAVFQFNPQQNPDYLKYVTIDRITLHVHSAELTAVGVHAWAELLNWEDTPADFYFATFQLGQINSSVIATGAWTDPTTLGRMEKGTNGQISVAVQEIINAVYLMNLSGFISEFPILARDFWRS